jgi:hypothetical protein
MNRRGRIVNNENSEVLMKLPAASCEELNPKRLKKPKTLRTTAKYA